MTWWLSFQLAAEEVERKLGSDLCDSGTVEWRQRYPGGPDVDHDDLHRWLKNKLTRKVGGKQSRIIRLLADMFPDGVPNPADYPRQTLTSELIKRDPGLASLSPKTLQKAIAAYNRQLGNVRNTNVS